MLKKKTKKKRKNKPRKIQASEKGSWISPIMNKDLKRTFLSFVFYAVPIMTILTWWTWAFKQYISDFAPTAENSQQKIKELPSVLKYLTPMQRETFHQALSGDYSLMIKLITDWDHDAQIMEQLGFRDIQRLSKDDYLRCQLLARQINNSTQEELVQLHDYYRKMQIVDDNGTLFDLSKSFRRFLPQSYVAASFLLALSEPKSIVALPRGMREQNNIYLSDMTRNIELDADRYNTEKLYEARPEIAFVADYSHPSTIQALQKQGIPLFTLKHVSSPEEIQNALIRIGHVIDRPLEAELLRYFVDASMQAIDNRFKILNTSFNTDESPTVLFLKHHLTFSTPTSHTLTGKLLKRMGVKKLVGDQFAQNHFAWTVPIHQEQILQINPDYIIIGTSHIEKSKHHILREPVFSLLSQQNKPIAFVDDDLQETPSQYMVLAYYDLFEAISNLDTP
jgi:iron complex transport system substrate-binding protein